MIPTLNQVTQSQEILKNQIQTQKIASEKEHQTDAVFKNEKAIEKEHISKTSVEKIMSSEINISFHKKTNQMIIKLVDGETKEVLREIPSEKFADMLAAIYENMGLFVDEKI